MRVELFTLTSRRGVAQGPGSLPIHSQAFRSGSVYADRQDPEGPAGRSRSGLISLRAKEKWGSVVKKSGKRTRREASPSPRVHGPPTADAGECANNTPRYIVCVGASAGGLEAFTELLSHLPDDTGMAFVLIQHLDPKHGSHLTELLSRESKMPIVEVIGDIRAESDHVYVISPQCNLGISGGVLHAPPRQARAPTCRSTHFSAPWLRTWAIRLLARFCRE